MKAELIGTFTLVFIGAGTGALAGPTQSGVGIVGVAFGPALAAGDLSYVWMYVVGPLGGGDAAALLYDKYFLPVEQKPPVEAADSPGKRRR